MTLVVRVSNKGLMKSLKQLIRTCLPRTIKPHRIWTGPLKGQKIVTSWHDYPSAIMGRNERPLLDWLAKVIKPGQTWLDVGSHYGYVALAMSRFVGESGRVYAFEPMLRTAGYVQQTRQNNALAQLTIVPFALANPKAIEVGHLSTSRGMIDSTIERGDWTEDFYITQLDWLWPQVCQNNLQIDGIKIDVQGMEIETLKGMRHLLKTQKPHLIVETHSGVDRQLLLTIIEEAGYDRHSTAIEPASSSHTSATLLDNHSYAFFPQQPTESDHAHFNQLDKSLAKEFGVAVAAFDAPLT